MFGSREEKGSFFGHGCGRLIEKNESEVGKPFTAQCGILVWRGGSMRSADCCYSSYILRES